MPNKANKRKKVAESPTKRITSKLWTPLFVCLGPLVFVVIAVLIGANFPPSFSSRGNEVEEASDRACALTFARTYPIKFPTSFWFVKSPKVGGSTIAGIFRALADRHGVAMVNPVHPSLGNPEWIPFQLYPEYVLTVLKEFGELGHAHFGIANHMSWSTGDMLGLGNIPRFTAVRDPVDRALSCVHANSCDWTRAVETVDGDRVHYCPKDFDSVLQSLRDIEWTMDEWGPGLKLPHQVGYTLGNAIFDRSAAERFDFIFVTKRMDESVVAFKITHGLSWGDVLFLPSKMIVYNRFQNMNATEQEAVRAILFKAPSFKEDVKFYQYASQRLDRVIAEIQERTGAFEEQLGCFQRLQRLAQDSCNDGSVPSEERGARFGDNGRNFKCVERIARLYGGGTN